MPIDPIVEENIIVAAVDAVFAQPVYEGFPDITLATYTNGNLNPYLTIDFGTPSFSASGRGILGEQKQPYVNRCVIASVAPTKKLARTLSSKVAKTFTGYTADSNTSAFRLVGGASYTITAPGTLPTAHVSEQWFSYSGNMRPEPA